MTYLIYHDKFPILIQMAPHVQHHLLPEAGLTYKKALEMAQVMEVVACDINNFQKQILILTTVQSLQEQKFKFSSMLSMWQESFCKHMSFLTG